MEDISKMVKQEDLTLPSIETNDSTSTQEPASFVRNWPLLWHALSIISLPSTAPGNGKELSVPSFSQGDWIAHSMFSLCSGLLNVLDVSCPTLSQDRKRPLS